MKNTQKKGTTSALKMALDVSQIAKDFQQITRQIKALEAQQRPLKELLLAYAKNNRTLFDEAFQIKFPNGTYVALRVANVLNGTSQDKQEFIKRTGDEFLKTELDEKLILQEILKNEHLQKLCTQLKLTIGQKESLAIYAG